MVFIYNFSSHIFINDNNTFSLFFLFKFVCKRNNGNRYDFILLLFLAIETSPIFAKLLSPRSTYDFKVEDAETAVKTNVLQNKYQREVLLKTDNAINDKIYGDIETEDELYTYKRKKVRELMQIQAEAFIKQQKNAL